jgi:hypothetical protein
MESWVVAAVIPWTVALGRNRKKDTMFQANCVRPVHQRRIQMLGEEHAMFVVVI